MPNNDISGIIYVISLTAIAKTQKTRAIRRPHSSPGGSGVRKQITCEAVVKGHGTKRKPIHDFLYNCNTNEVPISKRFGEKFIFHI